MSSGPQRGLEFGQEFLPVPFPVATCPIGYEVLDVVLDELVPSFGAQMFHLAILSPWVCPSVSRAKTNTAWMGFLSTGRE